ncbi:MAG: FIST N-terminal domain-containing protein [Geminicoccaceae bacterium]
MSGLVFAAGRPWPQLLRSVLDQLDGEVAPATLGLVFLADPTTEMADVMLDGLRQRTGIRTWLGAASTAVFAGGRELSGEGAIAALPLPLEGVGLHPFAGSPPAGAEGATCGILHLPDAADAGASVATLAAHTSAVLAGAQGASSFDHAQIAGSPSAGAATGVLISGNATMVTGVTHGCRPLGPAHRVTAGAGSTLTALDDRAATTWLAEEAGELVLRDQRQLRRQLLLAQVPMDVELAGSSLAAADSLFGIAHADPLRGALGISGIGVGGAGLPGRVQLFRRDPALALDDLQALAASLLRQLGGRRPKAALFYSSIERGVGFFGPGVDEATVLGRTLGPVPVIGMRSAAEVAGTKLTRYAAALALIA